MNASHRWLTFHRFRFAEPRSLDTFEPTPPEIAHQAGFGPDSPIGEDGRRTYVSDVWGGIAIYERRDEAEHVLAEPDHHLSWSADATEAWHALLCPISHRGEAHWFGATDATDHLRPAQDDPGGGTVVLTSAGFDIPDAAALAQQLPRIRDFLTNVERVRDWYGTLDGNLARMIVGPLGDFASDGMTFSLWRDDEAMFEAAYHPGVHRAQIDRHKTEHTADRTSFTRARLIASSGSWNGTNPATGILNAV